MSNQKFTPQQESRLRMAELELAVLTLPTWQNATRGERRIVLAKMLADDLRATHHPRATPDDNDS